MIATIKILLFSCLDVLATIREYEKSVSAVKRVNWEGIIRPPEFAVRDGELYLD